MSIQDTFEIDKEGEVVKHPLVRRYFLALVVVLVALLSFGVGRLSGESRPSGVTIEYDPSLIEATTSPEPPAAAPAGQAASVISASQAGAGSVFASSKGTKYYYPGCRNTISEKNKVTFASASMAEQAGYTLAATCPAK